MRGGRAGALAAGVLLAAATLAAAPSAVFVGRRVRLSAPVPGRVVALGGRIALAAPVSGDVVAWGADIDLQPGARVEGNLVAIGGAVSGDPSRVAGRILTPASLSGMYLAEAREVPWAEAGRRFSPAALGLRVLVVALWVAVSSAILWLRGSGAARGAEQLAEHPGVSAAAGVLSVAALFLSLVLAAAALPGALRVAAVAAVGSAAAILKLFGMTAFFLALGQKLLRDESAARRPAALTAGALAAGAVSLVPVAGPLLWSAASVVAIGGAAASRLGAPRWRVAVS